MCVQRIVGCRMGQCQRKLPFADREHHERFECRHRRVVCPQGCGEFVLSMHASKHMRSDCTWRLCECPLKCGIKTLRRKNLTEHLENECIRRGKPLREEFVPKSPSFGSSPPVSPSKTKGGAVSAGPATPNSDSKSKKGEIVKPMEIVGEPQLQLGGVAPVKDDGELVLKK